MSTSSFYNNPRNFLFQSLDIFIIGLIALIYIIIVLIIALRMISAYRKHKLSQHLFAGIAYFGAASTWSGIAFNFIIILMFNVVPPMEAHILINGGCVTISNFFWIMAVLSISKIDKKTQKVILTILGIFAVIVEVIFVYLTLTGWTSIMNRLITPIYGDYTQLAEMFYMFQLIIFIIPGFWMSIKSIKTVDKDVKLKGKLLTLSFLLFTVGAIFNIFITELLLFIIGLILITLSAIFFYYGFTLPNWIKNLFIKKK